MSYDWIIDVLFWIAVVFLAAGYVSWRATRLDRLHVRVETARAALDAALVRRAAAALELAASRLLDPATSLVLATAAHEARTADADNREFAESDLSRALRAVVDQPEFASTLAERADGDGKAVLEELSSAAAKVAYARRFYNDAVSQARIARRKLLVRVLPLHGRAPLPGFFEIDDDPPGI
ncbi:LemA family protein [Actinomadura litoris]|uniref:LemA family protein n=1 Tax=Actinomadura litoris TaxID=2678616 RepID=UPI001FA742DC|nr:LemA family protein [Actinomadura litoris]